jgi:hypothetical protein
VKLHFINILKLDFRGPLPIYAEKGWVENEEVRFASLQTRWEQMLKKWIVGFSSFSSILLIFKLIKLTVPFFCPSLPVHLVYPQNAWTKLHQCEILYNCSLEL